jgi:hypothetical protein
MKTWLFLKKLSERCEAFLTAGIVIVGYCVAAHGAHAAGPPAGLGTTWTLRQAPVGLRAVAFGAGKFVAVGDGVLATSPDGTVWTERSAPPGTLWNSVVYAQGKFVAVSSEESSSVVKNIMTSTDGITWTQINDGLGDGNRWRGVIQGGGLFVAGGLGVVSSSQLMTSSDGISWTARSVTAGAPGVYTVGYGGGTFVAVAFSNGIPNVTRIHSSIDGATWVARQLPAGVSEVELVGLTYGGGQFVAVGDNQGIFTSPDGVTWTNRSQSGAYWLVSVTYADGVFVVFGYRSSNYQSVILRSEDGIDWSEQTTPSVLTRNSSFYAHGIIIAFAAANGTTSDTIMTSGVFGVNEVADFVPNTARLTTTSRSAMLAALNQLDPSLRIKSTFVIKTKKSLSRASLASRRAKALTTFFLKKSNLKISSRVLVRKVSSVSPSEVNTAQGVFRYK